MKRLNELSVSLGFSKKPKFSDQLKESIGNLTPGHLESLRAKQESISIPVFSRLAERRTGFLDAVTSATGPIEASELQEFPTADCLSPEEVYEKETLGDDRVSHLSQCSWCQTMVRGSHASPEEAATWIRALEPRIHTRQRVASHGIKK
jgi:hypothetical protein